MTTSPSQSRMHVPDWVRYGTILAGSWLLGLLAWAAWAYWRAGRLYELHFVLYISSIALATCLPLVYLPCMLLLRRVLRGSRTVWLFPVVGAALGVFPLSIMSFMAGGLGSILATFRSGWLGIHIMIATVGVCVGTGFAMMARVRDGRGFSLDK